MTDAQGPVSGDDDVLIAYLRNQLSDDERQRVVERLRDDAALRTELQILETAAELFWEESMAATEEQSYATTSARLGLAPESNETRAQPEAHVARSSWVGRLRGWMVDHAAVLQPALVALVVVQAGVIAHYVGSDGGGADVTITRGSTGSCGDVWLTFRDGVAEREMRRMLVLYGGSIVDGPDEQGRYRVGFADAAARHALLESPDAAKLVSHTESPSGCSASDHESGGEKR